MALALAGCGQPKLGTEDHPIVMSFVPASDTPEAKASADQLAQMLTDQTDLAVVANAATDYAAVREAMASGNAQIGWLNTFNYLLANEKIGAEAALVTERLGTTSYRGQLIVRANSGITALADLEGSVMCWVDPYSASGYLVPRITLKANGIDPDKDFSRTVDAGSHSNVVMAVYKGDCDVGATYADARGSVADVFPAVTDKISVLATTADIANDSISFVKDFPPDVRDKISTALLEIAATEEGQAALGTLYSVAGLQAIDDAFYDPFRADLSQARISIEELAQ
jgi:phosphonate transport system substrate-binding protein